MLNLLTKYGGNPSNFDNRYWGSAHPMMFWAGRNDGVLLVYSILCLITWFLVIAVLVALLRWLWNKGDAEKNKK